MKEIHSICLSTLRNFLGWIKTIPKKSAVVLSFTVFLSTTAYSVNHNEYILIHADIVKDKIRGGLLGQIIGNLNGLPHEMKYVDEPGDLMNYLPSLPQGAWTDDDTDFEWVYVVEMQRNRTLFLSFDQIFNLWKERINSRIWSSNQYARYLMDIGISPPFTGNSILNPWASFNLSGQFLCETFALMAPAMPRTATRIGLNYTRVAIDNEPAQATQLFSTIIAMAFVENNIERLIDHGIAALDKESQLIRIVKDIKNWHATYPDSWRTTRKLLKEKYTLENGNIRDTNGHELNAGSVIAALLYGKGDFSESLKLAFNFGWDADCNAATVGTILGVINGYKNMMNQNSTFNPDWLVVDRYKNTTRDNMPMNETITSFADRIIELFELANKANGGYLDFDQSMMTYAIRHETPSTVYKLSTKLEQEKALIDNFVPDIKNDLLHGTREDRARAVYLAVCLGLNGQYVADFPVQWESACNELKGYWKIINNIFSKRHQFDELTIIQKKFSAAGFNPLSRGYSNQEVWNDQEIWKPLDELYNN